MGLMTNTKALATNVKRIKGHYEAVEVSLNWADGSQMLWPNGDGVVAAIKRIFKPKID